SFDRRGAVSGCRRAGTGLPRSASSPSRERGRSRTNQAEEITDRETLAECECSWKLLGRKVRHDIRIVHIPEGNVFQNLIVYSTELCIAHARLTIGIDAGNGHPQSDLQYRSRQDGKCPA